MKTTITTAQAMSHPDVALTINTLGAMADELREEIDALLSQVSGLQAARFAYASEFALDAEGQPDVGSIHQNIRALKDAARLALDALEQCNAADLDCTMEIAALKAVL